MLDEENLALHPSLLVNFSQDLTYISPFIFLKFFDQIKFATGLTSGICGVDEDARGMKFRLGLVGGVW